MAPNFPNGPRRRGLNPFQGCLIVLILVAWGILKAYHLLHQGGWNADRDLHNAIHKGDLAAVQSALSHGADPNSTSYSVPSSSGRQDITYRHPPFVFVATESSRPDIVEAVLDHGGNARALYKGESTIEWAFGDTNDANRPQVIGALIKHGADPNAPFTMGGPAIFWCADLRDDADLGVLLSSGANPNVPNSSGAYWYFWTKRYPFESDITPPPGVPTGATPLMLAVRANDQPAVRLLIAHGADVNARMSDGTTALSLVKNNPQMQQILTSAGAKQ
jgi:ankyrin repeat protein